MIVKMRRMYNDRLEDVKSFFVNLNVFFELDHHSVGAHRLAHEGDRPLAPVRLQ